MVCKNIFLPNFFIFDQRGPIFTLAVVTVFPKQVLWRQSTQKPKPQKQPPKDMRIRIPKFFSVLKNWRSNFFIFTPKTSYEVEILNMAEKVLKSGMVLLKFCVLPLERPLGAQTQCFSALKNWRSNFLFLHQRGPIKLKF